MVRYDITYPYEGKLKQTWFTSNRPSDEEVITETYDKCAARENAFKTLNDILVKEQKDPISDPDIIDYNLTVINKE